MFFIIQNIIENFDNLNYVRSNVLFKFLGSNIFVDQKKRVRIERNSLFLSILEWSKPSGAIDGSRTRDPRSHNPML